MFVQGSHFTKMWQTLGFDDNDLRRLELTLLDNPKAGAVIVGTGRLRKIRFARRHQGKSGGVRVCYVDFAEKGICYLLAVFAKNEQTNLSDTECSALKSQIDLLESTLKGGASNE